MMMSKNLNEIASSLNFPETGEIINGVKVLNAESDYDEGIFSYKIHFNKGTRRSDIPNLLKQFFTTQMLLVDDTDRLIISHDYVVKSTAKGTIVSGQMVSKEIVKTNPTIKGLTAIEDFNQEYSKMELKKADTYFRVFPYRGFNGPQFRSKLFSFVSNMGENYGYCDGSDIYYRRASLIMPKIKISKSIPNAKMMFHTHPANDEPSLSSADDYLLYFDMSHKPMNIRHFYTVMKDRMDYFYIIPKSDKKKDYVKLSEQKFIDELDAKIDEIASELDEKLDGGSHRKDLVYCEKVTKGAVKWLNKKYANYFKIKYKCYYRVKRNPDKDTADDLHLGDEFIAKAINDIKSGKYSWPEFGSKKKPQENYAYWHAQYFANSYDLSETGYLRFFPGDHRRFEHFFDSRVHGTSYTYYDVLNILALSYDIRTNDKKVRDGKESKSRIEDILDFLEIKDKILREDLIVLDALLQTDVYTEDTVTKAGDHYFILPLADYSIKSLQAMEEVRKGANLEQKQYEISVLLSEKMSKKVAEALGVLNKNLRIEQIPVTVRGLDGIVESTVGINPPLALHRSDYVSTLPKKIFDNVDLLSEALYKFKREDKPLVTRRNKFNLSIPVENNSVTVLISSKANVQLIVTNSADPSTDALSAMNELIKELNRYGFEIDTEVTIGSAEPLRNPNSLISILISSPIESVKENVINNLAKRLDSSIVTVFTTKPLKEYERKTNLVEVTDKIFTQMEQNGDILVSVNDGFKRGYKRADFKNKYAIIDAHENDINLLQQTGPVISFYLKPTNTDEVIRNHLLKETSPQQADRILEELNIDKNVERLIEFDIEIDGQASELVFNELPLPNPKKIKQIFGNEEGFFLVDKMKIEENPLIHQEDREVLPKGPPFISTILLFDKSEDYLTFNIPYDDLDKLHDYFKLKFPDNITKGGVVAEGYNLEDFGYSPLSQANDYIPLETKLGLFPADWKWYSILKMLIENDINPVGWDQGSEFAPWAFFAVEVKDKEKLLKLVQDYPGFYIAETNLAPNLKPHPIEFDKKGHPQTKKNPPTFEFSRDKNKRKKRWNFVTKSSPRELYRKARDLAIEKNVFFEIQEVILKEPEVKNVPANVKQDFLNWYYIHLKKIMFWLGSEKDGQLATIERTVLLKPLPKSVEDFVNSYDTKHRSEESAPRLADFVKYRNGKLMSASSHGLNYFGKGSAPKSTYPIMFDSGGGHVEDKYRFKGYYAILKLLEAYYMESNGVEGYGVASSLQRLEYFRSFGWLMPQDMKYAPYIHRGARDYLRLEDDKVGWDSSLEYIWRPVYSKAKKNPSPTDTTWDLKKKKDTIKLTGEVQGKVEVSFSGPWDKKNWDKLEAIQGEYKSTLNKSGVKSFIFIDSITADFPEKDLITRAYIEMARKFPNHHIVSTSRNEAAWEATKDLIKTGQLFGVEVKGLKKPKKKFRKERLVEQGPHSRRHWGGLTTMKAMTPLQRLLLAKEHSDNNRYAKKNDILKELLRERPEEFVIDSDDPDYPGITHTPTKFKIHIPQASIPYEVDWATKSIKTLTPKQ